MTLRRILILTICAVLCLGVVGIPSAASAKGRYRVSMALSTTTLVQGEAVTVTGKVTPKGKAKGTKLKLQVRYSSRGKWKTAKTTRVNSKGTYRFTERPTTVKQRWYRVLAPKNKKKHRSAGASRPAPLQVYGWVYLVDRPAVSDYRTGGEVVNISGRTYPKSYSTDNHADEWDLNRKCIALSTTVGISDESSSGSAASVELFNDGASVYSRTFGFGQGEAATINVTNVLRLKFEVVTTGPSHLDTYGALGSPRVLCRA